MLALKSYGIVQPQQHRASTHHGLRLPRIDCAVNRLGKFSLQMCRLVEERSRVNPMYRTTAFECGKFLDFNDLAYEGPIGKNNRDNSFSEQYIAGSFEDTSLGSVERRKTMEKRLCQVREARRQERRQRFEKSQKVRTASHLDVFCTCLCHTDNVRSEKARRCSVSKIELVGDWSTWSTVKPHL